MRTNTRRLGTLSIASALVLLSSGTALADRRAALNGNQLINDSEDVFLYPSEALQYNKRLEVEVGGDGGTARALFLGGWDDLVLGMSAQQGAMPGLFTGPVPADLLARESAALWLPTAGGGSLSGTQSPFGSIGFAGEVAPFSMIDGFLAVPVGDMNFGLRATVGMTGNSESNNAGDTGTTQTLLGLTGGLNGGEAGGTRWDASLSFNMNMLSTADMGVDESGLNLRVSGSTRIFIPYNEWLDIGVLGNVAFFTGSRTVTPMGGADSTESRVGFGLMGGAGPVYHLPDGSTLAVYGLLGLAMSGRDPNTENDADIAINDLVIFFPAVRAAAEVAITDWFFARAGLQYAFQNATSSFDSDGDPSATVRTGSLGWSAGVGAKTGRFTIDGALQQAWLTQGPDFIGGDSGLFGVVSVAYQW